MLTHAKQDDALFSAGFEVVFNISKVPPQGSREYNEIGCLYTKEVFWPESKLYGGWGGLGISGYIVSSLAGREIVLRSRVFGINKGVDM